MVNRSICRYCPELLRLDMELPPPMDCTGCTLGPVASVEYMDDDHARLILDDGSIVPVSTSVTSRELTKLLTEIKAPVEPQEVTRG